MSRPLSCARARTLLPLHYYDAVDAPERDLLARHLEACTACGAAWDRTRSVLSAVTSEAAFPREAEIDWAANARVTVARAAVAAGARERRMETPARWGARRLAGILAAAAILVVAIGFGLRRPPRPASAGATVPDAESRSGDAAARYLQESVARRAAARSLRDGRSLLVDLMQSPVRCRRSDGTLDVAFEKERSRDLLRRMAVSQGTLSGPADRRLAELLGQLEFTLLQVTSLSDCAAARQIHELRQAIERRQLLLRIDLATRDLDEGRSRA